MLFNTTDATFFSLQAFVASDFLKLPRNRLLFLLLIISLLHLALMNSGVMFFILCSWCGFHVTRDKSRLTFHRVSPFLAEHVEVVGDETVASYRSPVGCSG